MFHNVASDYMFHDLAKDTSERYVAIISGTALISVFEYMTNLSPLTVIGNLVKFQGLRGDLLEYRCYLWNKLFKDDGLDDVRSSSLAGFQICQHFLDARCCESGFRHSRKRAAVIRRQRCVRAGTCKDRVECII